MSELVTTEIQTELEKPASSGRIASIHYVANPDSMHVDRWLKILARTNCDVTIETANRVASKSTANVNVNPLLPGWLALPMTIRYFLAGVALRFQKPSASCPVMHAHSASGNGTTAWLSGRRYVVGTYGTEILGAKDRGPLYRWLIGNVLRKAERISACSQETVTVLEQRFQIPRERIHFFHLGYDESTFHPLDEATRMRLRHEAGLPNDEPIWVVNRRIHPHYRTVEVVEGFLQFCQTHPVGRLVLLCGDQEPDYARQVRDCLADRPGCERIKIVEGMMPQFELARWVQQGDFAISVPRSDNFSISTLEAMGCGTIPVLANHVAYDPLRECPAVRWMTRFESADFAEMFAATAALSKDQRTVDRHACAKFARQGFSTAEAITRVEDFYLGNESHEAPRP